MQRARRPAASGRSRPRTSRRRGGGRPRRPRSRGGGSLDEDAGYIGEEEKPLSAQADCQRPRSLVGVHVQRSPREGRDHRCLARRERVHDRRRAGGERLTDEAELGNTCRLHADLVAHQAHGGAERGAELEVHAREGLAHDRQGSGVGHAAAADERDRQAEAVHLGRDLRAGAVHDAHAVPAGAEALHRGGRGPRHGTAALHDEEAHVVYSALRRT